MALIKEKPGKKTLIFRSVRTDHNSLALESAPSAGIGLLPG